MQGKSRLASPPSLRAFLPAVAAFGVLLLLTAESSPAQSRGPNIIFILADDLGYTDLACYGSKYYETPHIDHMAAQGMRFTDGYTCGPNCQPTRAALLSGQYGPRTGVYTVGGIDRFDWRSRPLRPVDNVTQLPLKKITLAEALKSAGYATGMFGKWHLGQSPEYHPGKRGFDEAIVSMGKHFDFDTSPKVDYPPGTYLADFLTDKAVEFIRRHREGPFFLYLPHFGVHSPHEAKEPLIDKFQSKRPAGGHHDPTYAAMIASVDESVGRVLATLDELKLADETLVVFSSDNGGVGGYQKAGVSKTNSITDNTPLRGGKGMLYEGGIRVPYIFRWPGVIAAGTQCDQPINSVDLYPTLLELAKGKPTADYKLDGVSYVKLLEGDGKAKLDRGPLYWHFPGYLGAGQGGWRTTPVSVIRAGDWKLMEFLEDGRLELYNLRKDLSETRDRAGEMPERVKELHEQLVAWRKEIKAPMPGANTEADKAKAETKKGKKKGRKKSD
jgi:arylsulfatase A-like enzyme